MQQTLKQIAECFDKFPQEYSDKCLDVWKQVSQHIQEQKLSNSGIIDPVERSKILNQLIVRPALLSHFFLESNLLLNKLNCNIVEVGTAQGLQSLTFASCFKRSTVWTCDIKDDRDLSFESYDNVKFVLGTSKELRQEFLKTENNKVDFCWIDGAHDKFDVITDFLNLLKLTDKHTIWAFDDYDKRFGCWDDLNTLTKFFNDHIVIELGKTGSGNPNRILIAKGCEIC